MYSTSSFYVSSIFKILFILIIDSFPLNYWITNQFITFQILCMHIYRTDLMIFISIIIIDLLWKWRIIRKHSYRIIVNM